MEYQVLARKYRPKTFSSMMGQEHVLKALANALETERLHHAYLFTGTRGVGKTTVARVLAKALNCEQGISANPCGECAACQEIDQGRFVDLIEVDAASRTRVEDTRELLDNVQYAPTRGRFKIYLIDEVHMLSGHSFNALLKTLEEPPPHVKFLLATTDPQKLPVTILSRCLQFNLKRLNIEQLEQQMQTILHAENIAYEAPVLKPLAIAADGSMRDALSLLDQAIAYCNGTPNLADVEAMLGTVQNDRIFNLLVALANNDGSELIAQSRQLAEQGLDVNTILAELINTLQRIALCQMVPDILDDSYGDKILIEQLAQAISAEDVQLYYQIALNGRKDLPFSPQPQGGFEMILLRMLAFRPVGSKKTDELKKKSDNDQKPSLIKRSEEVKPEPSESLKSLEPITKTEPVKMAEPANQAQAAVKPSEKTKEPALLITSAEASIQTPEKLPEIEPSAPDMGELPPLESYGEQYFTDDDESKASLFESQPVAEMQQEPVLSEPALIQPESESVQKASMPMAVKEPVPEPESVLKQKRPETPGGSKKSVQSEPVPCQKTEGGQLVDYWCELIQRSQIKGFEQQLAKHCALINKSPQNNQLVFELLLESVHKHLLSDKIKNRLQEAFQSILEQTVILNIKECQLSPQEQLQTPRRKEILAAEALQKEAVESIYADQKVKMLVDAFGAAIREESIKPLTTH